MGDREARSWKSLLAGAMLFALAVAPQTLLAGEGGTTHVLPGANATLMDVLPTSPGWFVKRCTCTTAARLPRGSLQLRGWHRIWMRA